MLAKKQTNKQTNKQSPSQTLYWTRNKPLRSVKIDWAIWIKVKEIKESESYFERLHAFEYTSHENISKNIRANPLCWVINFKSFKSLRRVIPCTRLLSSAFNRTVPLVTQKVWLNCNT